MNMHFRQIIIDCIHALSLLLNFVNTIFDECLNFLKFLIEIMTI